MRNCLASFVAIFLNFNFFNGSRLDGRGPSNGHNAIKADSACVRFREMMTTG